jgi:hypothetical protein
MNMFPVYTSFSHCSFRCLNFFVFNRTACYPLSSLRDERVGMYMVSFERNGKSSFCTRIYHDQDVPQRAKVEGFFGRKPKPGQHEIHFQLVAQYISSCKYKWHISEAPYTFILLLTVQGKPPKYHDRLLPVSQHDALKICSKFTQDFHN